MSRGPGRTMRAVLKVLADQIDADGWLTVPELAALIVGPVSTRAEQESIRRAVKRLAATSRVDVEYFGVEVDVHAARVDWGDWVVYRRRHRAYRPVLAAHWPLSVEQKAARDRSWRESLDRLAALDSRIGAPGGQRDPEAVAS